SRRAFSAVHVQLHTETYGCAGRPARSAAEDRSARRPRGREQSTYGVSLRISAGTFTAPIVPASVPNQICRVERSNVICRIVFAVLPLLNTGIDATHDFVFESNATSRLGCTPV